MFNDELKTRFINERIYEAKLPDNYLKREFNKVEQMEIELNKDISNFTVYEIKAYYKSLYTTSIGVLEVLNSQFSIYTQWCLQQNLVKDSQNHFLEMTKSNIDSCLHKALLDEKLITASEIIKIVDTVINPRDQFIILALFEGLYGEFFDEIAMLRPEDINDNIATLCNGRKTILSSKLLAIIEECIKEDTYYCSAEFKNGGKKTVPLTPSGYILKNFPNVVKDDAKSRGYRVSTSFRKVFVDLGYEYINPKNIIDSGKIDMIKRRAAELGIGNIEFVRSNYIKEVEEKYGCKIVKSTFLHKFGNYLS